jgi:DNA-binding PadR family transcriptional regulator
MARVSIFKGREARLNKAIFWILAHQDSLTIYEIWRKLRAQRDFAYVRYHIVNRRVKRLEMQGFIEKAGERGTKTGFQAALYKLTVRFYLAILLEEFDMDDFLRIASDEDAVTMLLILVSQQYRGTKRLEAML